MNVADCGKLFSAANKIIFAELHWDVKLLMQTENCLSDDRSNGLVEYLLANYTLDGLVWDLICNQMNSPSWNKDSDLRVEFVKAILENIDTYNISRLDGYVQEDSSEGDEQNKNIFSGVIRIHMEDGDDSSPPKPRIFRKPSLPTFSNQLIGSKRPLESSISHLGFAFGAKVRKNFE